MLKITLNGNSMLLAELANELDRQVKARVVRDLRDRLTSIRHPDTGEFCTVVVEGTTLDDMSLRVEGSPALLAILEERFTVEEREHMIFSATDTSEAALAPRVFLSYGWEDRALAKKIAEALHVSGIDTWWAEWEIGPGDSIRRKIDEGLGECTHFVVLLTPTSVSKPWVNEEIDAGYVRKVSSKSRFIPLRNNLSHEALPPLMSGLLSPEVNDDGTDLQQLINDIRGVSRRPVRRPAQLAAPAPQTGYSPAAASIAAILVRSSTHGTFADPQLEDDDIMKQTGLTSEDVTDALHELRHHVVSSFGRVYPKDTLFAEFDRYWQSWDPAVDALKLAADLVNNDAFPTEPEKIAELYGWPARRLNPAMAYLQARDAAYIYECVASGPFMTALIRKTDATRRFVKSRSQ